MKADKQREVRDGHDGTWVAHPALVGVALDIFNAGMRTPNQVQSQSEALAQPECLRKSCACKMSSLMEVDVQRLHRIMQRALPGHDFHRAILASYPKGPQRRTWLQNKAMVASCYFQAAC